MTLYSDFIYYSGTNSPVANQAVTIKDHGTDTNSTIYDGTGAVIANPVYTDTLGKFEFYVADGAATYDIYVNSVIYDSFSSVTVPEKLDTANPSATGTFTLNGTDLTSDFTKLHSVTASAAELNKLAGCPASATDFSYVAGLTGGVQAQLDAKDPLQSAHWVVATSGSVSVPGNDSTDIVLGLTGHHYYVVSAYSADAVSVLPFYLEGGVSAYVIRTIGGARADLHIANGTADAVTVNYSVLSWV